MSLENTEQQRVNLANESRHHIQTNMKGWGETIQSEGKCRIGNGEYLPRSALGTESRSDLVESERRREGEISKAVSERGVMWVGSNLYQVVTNETTSRLRWRGISSSI